MGAFEGDLPQETVVPRELAAERPPLNPRGDRTEATDETLEALRRGHAPAFEQLYRDHGGRMKSVARNLLGNVSDAEDAVQEAFLKVYRGVSSFKGDSALSTWLYRILVNTCFDMGRRRKSRREVAEPDAPAAVPLARTCDHALRLTIERALERLNPTRRAVFLLFEVEGFKHGEIADILAIPEGTSKHALFLAKRELQAAVLSVRGRRHES